MEEIQTIAIENLREPRILLRVVDTQSVAFLELRDSIKNGGLLNSIAARPDKQQPGMYEVVDGMYRFTCCKMLGWTSMPCIVKEMTDAEVLAAQISANAIRPETKPVEFAKQLKRLQREFPDITLSELSHMVGKTTTWVKKQLSLLNLIKVAHSHLDRDELSLSNAYMLAKIPKCFQNDYLTQALVLPPRGFTEVARTVIQNVMESAKKGSLEFWFVQEFKPQPFLRPLKHVLKELEGCQVAAAMIATQQCTSPLEAWRAALKWACNLDQESIDEQRRAAELRHEKQHIERTAYVDEIDLEVPDLD